MITPYRQQNPRPKRLLLVWASVIIFVLVALVWVLSTTAGCRNEMKHLKSSVVGLNRVITLYDANGNVIRQWKTKAKVEPSGSSVWFLDDNGRATSIAGTFVVEESKD